jgi:hypothetical protein
MQSSRTGAAAAIASEGVRRIPVLHVCRMEQKFERPPFGINHCMPLPAFHLLASIIPFPRPLLFIERASGSVSET